MGFYQSRKRGGNRKRLLCFWKTVLQCARFLRIFGFLPAVLQAKQKRTPILIESTCVCRIGVARLELAASCSQSRRATNCATPRHLAARLHRQNIVYRFLCGSSIQNPQLTVLHGLLFSVGRIGSWQQQKRTRQQALFMATGCGFGATDKKRMQKLGRVQNLLHSSCKLAGKVLS